MTFLYQRSNLGTMGTQRRTTVTNHLFSHPISAFSRKRVGKTERSFYKPSILNRMFQLCGWDHSGPRRVNMEPIPSGKNLIARTAAQSWAAVWLTEIYTPRDSPQASIGSGSMQPDTAQRHSQPCASATHPPAATSWSGVGQWRPVPATALPRREKSEQTHILKTQKYISSVFF